MSHGFQYLENPEFAMCDPGTLVPRGWDFRVHDAAAPLRDRWLSHYGLGGEERAGLALLGPARLTDRGLVSEAVGQWTCLPPYETRPELHLGLGFVSPGEESALCWGDFRVVVELESGAQRELFWGRGDSTLWRDLKLPLDLFAGQTVRLTVENISEAVLLVDYLRVTGHQRPASVWQIGDLEISVEPLDPFLTEADAIAGEVEPTLSQPSRLLALEQQGWLAELSRGGPYQYGDVACTRRPRFAKAGRGLHLFTLTDQRAMRRSILHRALADALRLVRSENMRSLVMPPLVVGSDDIQEIRLFARDLAAELIEWYRTYHPRQFRRLQIATLFQSVEVAQAYRAVFDETFSAGSKLGRTPDREEVIRLAGLANLVKAALQSRKVTPAVLENIVELLDSLHASTGDFRETMGRVLEEAGISEHQMLDILASSYRHEGRLDDRALDVYERLYALHPAGIENVRAMASAYRCRFRVDGEKTRAVYEQVFRADPADEENNRFLAAQCLLAGGRAGSSMRELVLEKVGLGPVPEQASRWVAPSAFPARPLPAAEPFVHPQDRPGWKEAEDAGAPARGEAAPATEEAPRAEAPPDASASSEVPVSAEAGPPSPAAGAAVSHSDPEQAAQPPEDVAESAADAPEEPPAEPDLADTSALLERLAAELQEGRKRAEAREARTARTPAGPSKQEDRDED